MRMWQCISFILSAFASASQKRRTSMHVPKKDEWYTEIGLELLDEQTGQKLSGSVGTSTQASSVPEAWGPCESVYLTNVPPYWRFDVLQEVLMIQGTG